MTEARRRQVIENHLLADLMKWHRITRADAKRLLSMQTAWLAADLKKLSRAA